MKSGLYFMSAPNSFMISDLINFLGGLIDRLELIYLTEIYFYINAVVCDVLNM